MGVTAIFTDPFFPLLIQGVSIACNASDYSVMLWLDDPEEYERRTVRQILYWPGGWSDRGFQPDSTSPSCLPWARASCLLNGRAQPDQ